MLELLDGLRCTDQLAGAAVARIELTRLLVVLTHRRRSAHGTGVRKHVRLSALRPLLDHDLHNLRDHVAGALYNDSVPDANIDPLADRFAEAVEALDVVFIVQRYVDDCHTADGHRIEAADRCKRPRTSYLNINAAQDSCRALGGEFVRDSPAGLAGDEPPSTLQLELIDFVHDTVDVIAEGRALRLDRAVLLEQLLDAHGAAHQRADCKAPCLEF